MSARLLSERLRIEADDVGHAHPFAAEAEPWPDYLAGTIGRRHSSELTLALNPTPWLTRVLELFG